jgi:hypothetical protein
MARRDEKSLRSPSFAPWRPLPQLAGFVFFYSQFHKDNNTMHSSFKNTLRAAAVSAVALAGLAGQGAFAQSLTRTDPQNPQNHLYGEAALALPATVTTSQGAKPVLAARDVAARSNGEAAVRATEFAPAAAASTRFARADVRAEAVAVARSHATEGRSAI